MISSNYFSSEAKNVVVYLIATLLFTNFLFFIDEGYYSFYWMSNPANWFAFGIYTFVLFTFQIVINLLLANIITNNKARITSIVLGLPLGLYTLILLLSR